MTLDGMAAIGRPTAGLQHVQLLQQQLANCSIVIAHDRLSCLQPNCRVTTPFNNYTDMHVRGRMAGYEA